MAITKTLIANGSKGYHKFTLNVTEARTSGNSSFNDYSFILSPIQTGWDWYDHGGGISYEIRFTEKIVNKETNEITTNELYKATGTIPAYNGSSTIVLASGSDIEIVHDVDGTKTIEISFKVTDITGANYTCGNASESGSMILSVLHTPPEITNVSISETNAALTNLGVTNDTIVQYLSKKKFTITTTTYDDAKISSYSIYHNNVLIGTSTTNEVTIDFSNVSELMTSGTNYVGLTIAVIDDKDGYNTRIFNFPVIKYTKPTIESTSTTIKRKTSGGTVLTDNKVLLNFVGTCYKENDVVGNANKPTVQYKIWNTTEPSYTTVTSTNTANVTVKNFEISNIAYTSVYNYKIKIYDVFTNSSANPIEKTSIVPTGVSVWDEYKDRVNFLRITIGGKTVLPNEASGKSSMVWLNSDLSITPNVVTKIPFDKLEGDEGYFKLSDNGVEILQDCKLLVFFQWTAWGNFSKYAYINLNDTEEKSFTLTESATVITQAIIECKKGDIVYGKVYAENSVSVTSAKTQTNMQLIIIK